MDEEQVEFTNPFRCNMRLDGDVEVGALKLRLTSSDAISLALSLLAVSACSETDATIMVQEYYSRNNIEPV